VVFTSVSSTRSGSSSLSVPSKVPSSLLCPRMDSHQRCWNGLLPSRHHPSSYDDDLRCPRQVQMFDGGSQIAAKEVVRPLFEGAGPNILRAVACHYMTGCRRLCLARFTPVDRVNLVAVILPIIDFIDVCGLYGLALAYTIWVVVHT